MKRMLLMVVFLLSQVVVAHADQPVWDQQPNYWESRIPDSIKTPRDYQRYQDASKGFKALGVVCLVAAVVVDRQAKIYQRRADNINIAPTLMFIPQPGGGTLVMRRVEDGLVAGQNRYIRKAKLCRYSRTGLGLLSVLSFSVSYSIQF